MMETLCTGSLGHSFDQLSVPRERCTVGLL